MFNLSFRHGWWYDDLLVDGHVVQCRPCPYYLEALSAGAEEYYLRRDDLPGRWLGRAAAGLGLSAVVDPDDLRALLAGKRPDGSDLRNTWVLRPGYDATFSAPLSRTRISAEERVRPVGPWRPRNCGSEAKY